jgi:Na+/H+-dicarboxylate symporter
MAASSPEWKFFGLSMWQQVLIGIAAGVALGFSGFDWVPQLQVLGTVFIKLIKMVVPPMIFFALIAGITSLSSAHHFKKMAIKGTLAYLLTALMAVAMGLLLGTVFEPGIGVQAPQIASTVAAVPPPAIGDFFMGLIPENIIKSMADSHYIQIVIFAVFTGIVMNNISGSSQRVKEINQELAHIFFKMIEWIVRLAPLAVFGFMANMVATTGMEMIYSLLEMVVLVVSACLVQMVLFGVLIAVFAKISPLPFYRKMIPTQIMAFSTSSSKATLTTAMRELQDKMGVSQSSSNFMMPLGASINMDGTAIYLGLCAMFFAQMYGIEIGAHEYLMLMITCTLGSIGAAGIPSGSIIFMGMVLTSVGIPMEGIGVILGIDRILDMFRTTVNITGDAAITLIIDKTEGELKLDEYHA